MIVPIYSVGQYICAMIDAGKMTAPTPKFAIVKIAYTVSALLWL